MAQEPEALPIPDPRKLQPEGLSNKVKRYIFFGIFGVVSLVVLANTFGGSPAVPPSGVKGQSSVTKQQQGNPTAAQLEEYARMTQQQAALFEKTKADAANLDRLRSGQNPISATDPQQTAALREAAQVQQQYQAQQQQYVAQQARQNSLAGTPDKQQPTKQLDSLVRQERAQSSPVLAPWQQHEDPAAQAATQDFSAARLARAAGPSVPATNARKPLDFDPERKTFWLPEGTLLEAVITNRLNGDGTGPVNAMITSDVYLPGTRVITIPQGARALGEASKVTVSGQQRLAVAFHRLIVPGLHSYSIPLDSKPPALAQAGEVGLHDKVDNHYFSIFGTSLAIGAIGGLAQLGNGQTGFGYDPSVQFHNGVSQSTAQSSERVLDKFLNRLPTLTIREGTRARILLTDDLQVPVYERTEL